MLYNASSAEQCNNEKLRNKTPESCGIIIGGFIVSWHEKGVPKDVKSISYQFTTDDVRVDSFSTLLE